MPNDRNHNFWLDRIAALIVFLAITIMDIIVVELIFRPTVIWGYIRYYHIALFIIMLLALIIAGFLLSRNWRFSTYLFILILLGVEDTCYYLLQGKIPPETLPWIWGAPSRIELFIRNIIAIIVIILLEYLDKKYYFWNKLLEYLLV